MTSKTRLLLVSGVLAFSFGTLPSAAAPQYFFCLAPDYKSKVVYITNVFHSTIDRERLQDALRVHLDSQGRSFDVVQCPSPAELPQATEAVNDAERFNKASGFKIVPVPISNN